MNTSDDISQLKPELIRLQFENLVYQLFEKNPWPKKKQIIEFFNLYRYKSLVKELEQILKRHKMAELFTFAIPSFEALSLITLYQPILEIGAGSGFWAELLKRNLKCDIVATTIDSKSYPFPKKFTQIEYLSAIEAIKKYPHRTILSCWPDGTYLEEILPYIEKNFIYIGEWGTMVSLTEKCCDILEKEFELISVYVLPQWFGIHDEIHIFKRKN